MKKFLIVAFCSILLAFWLFYFLAKGDFEKVKEGQSINEVISIMGNDFQSMNIGNTNDFKVYYWMEADFFEFDSKFPFFKRTYDQNSIFYVHFNKGIVTSKMHINNLEKYFENLEKQATGNAVK